MQVARQPDCVAQRAFAAASEVAGGPPFAL